MTSTRWQDNLDPEPQERAMLQARELLTPAAVLSAVGAELAARDKRITALELELKVLRETIAAIERGEKRRAPIIPFDKTSLIA